MPHRPRFPGAMAALAALLLLGMSGPPVSGAESGRAPPKSEAVHKAEAIAMYGKPKYGPGFTHFDYVNPDAPKGGTIRLSPLSSTFDSLNPFIIKGIPAAGSGTVFDTLMVSSRDEPFTMYCLVCKTVEWPDDRTWVIFNLRPEARFHDGSPLTADDVIWSLKTLREKGAPFYRLYFQNVAKAEKLGTHRVRFVFEPGAPNRELPMILGQFPILSKKYYQTHEFDKTTLTPPLGSGPYRVADVNQPRSITYERVKDYWGRDLAVNAGQNNFDTIKYIYYRDQTVALEAFKAGQYDRREENNSKLWATQYNGPAFDRGDIIKADIPHDLPTGMQCFAYNIRRVPFDNPKVREALAYAFDFPWSNKNLFYGQYTRTKSYFSNSELASHGLPQGRELEILNRFRGRIPDRVFTQAYAPPTTDGSGEIRANLKIAFRLLKEGGWVVRNMKLVNARTGRQMHFEILLVSPAFERVVQPFVRNLRRLGIDVTYRTVDSAQYQNRVQTFDFDMIVHSFGESLSPGNEQRDYWGSDKADVPGSQNVIGIKNPVVDKLVEMIIQAQTREDLVARVHALDRVLLWNFYVIPQWHIGYHRIAWWDKFGRPKQTAKYGSGTEGWWYEPNAAKRAAAE